LISQGGAAILVEVRFDISVIKELID